MVSFELDGCRCVAARLCRGWSLQCTLTEAHAQTLVQTQAHGVHMHAEHTDTDTHAQRMATDSAHPQTNLQRRETKAAKQEQIFRFVVGGQVGGGGNACATKAECPVCSRNDNRHLTNCPRSICCTSSCYPPSHSLIFCHARVHKNRFQNAVWTSQCVSWPYSHPLLLSR